MSSPILKFILLVLEVLFVAKIAWNCVILLLVRHEVRVGRMDKNSGTSLAPVEVLIWGLCILVSLGLSEKATWFQTRSIAWIGAVAIAGSYLVLALTAIVLKFIDRRGPE